MFELFAEEPNLAPSGNVIVSQRNRIRSAAGSVVFLGTGLLCGIEAGQDFYLGAGGAAISFVLSGVLAGMAGRGEYPASAAPDR